MREYNTFWPCVQHIKDKWARYTVVAFFFLGFRHNRWNVDRLDRGHCRQRHIAANKTAKELPLYKETRGNAKAWNMAYFQCAFGTETKVMKTKEREKED